MTTPTVHFVPISLDIQAHSRQNRHNGNFNDTPFNLGHLSVTPSSAPRDFNDTPPNRTPLLVPPSSSLTRPRHIPLRSWPTHFHPSTPQNAIPPILTPQSQQHTLQYSPPIGDPHSGTCDFNDTPSNLGDLSVTPSSAIRDFNDTRPPLFTVRRLRQSPPSAQRLFPGDSGSSSRP